MTFQTQQVTVFQNWTKPVLAIFLVSALFGFSLSISWMHQPRRFQLHIQLLKWSLFVLNFLNRVRCIFCRLKDQTLTLDLPGGGGLLVFFTGSPMGPRWSKFWPQKEYVNTCLCFYFDLRPFWGVSDVLVRFYLNFNVSHRGLLEDWKRWFFWNVALKKPQTHFFLGKIPTYYVATYLSFNLRPLPANLVHF